MKLLQDWKTVAYKVICSTLPAVLHQPVFNASLSAGWDAAVDARVRCQLVLTLLFPAIVHEAGDHRLGSVSQEFGRSSLGCTGTKEEGPLNEILNRIQTVFDSEFHLATLLPLCWYLPRRTGRIPAIHYRACAGDARTRQHG